MKWDVSIGIPVYNGEDRLEYLLESLVKNHSGVKEIIVSDNASTDKTSEICDKYVKEYPNLVYCIHQKKTIPAMYNFKETLNHATGKYTIIIGHHDLISENYFDELVPMLENNPLAVAAMPMLCSFKKNDIANATETFNPCKSTMGSLDKRERVYNVLTNRFASCVINNLHRTKILKRVADETWIKEYICSDCVHSMYVALLGECCVSDKARYYYWSRDTQSTEDYVKRVETAAQVKMFPINSMGYIPRLRWELCKTYAAEFADEVLYNDIELATLTTQDFTYDNDYWMERHQILFGEINIPERRAFAAISLALKDERRRLFYEQSIHGSQSVFRGRAEQLAATSYGKMWEILMNEGYLFPKYKLGRAESDLFMELMKLKSEGASR